jgi:RNA polymerase sigma factor (sigma-70 family)
MGMKTFELVERIQAGRDVQRAEEELYGQVRAQLLGRIGAMIPRRLKARLDPEDVLHEAFLRAIRSIHTFRPAVEGSFMAWVHVIARNLIADSNKRHSVAVVRFAEGGGEGSPTAAQIPHRRQRRPESQLLAQDSIETMLSRLPPKESEVIRLHALNGRTFQEIALGWKKTSGAVQRFFSRAWRHLLDISRGGAR